MPLKPFEVAGQLYDKAALIEFREQLIGFRDAALDNGNMTASVFISHNIGIFAHIIKEMEDAPG